MSYHSNLQPKFNIAYIKLATKTEGPFTRTCIWFQGCNIKCPGCANVDLQSLEPRNIVTLEQLLNIVKEAKEKYDIEGVTLSGGEPTLQKELHVFNQEIRKMGLGIIMFTGKNIKELDDELIESVDLIIDGPFIESKLDEKRILLGSTNKKLHFITDRYTKHKDYFDNEVSINEITVEDYIFINGD
jgi:anaerobic ribonucleoside-triphosphate reductase activating protein